jgi:hypothetical protein
LARNAGIDEAVGADGARHHGAKIGAPGRLVESQPPAKTPTPLRGRVGANAWARGQGNLRLTATRRQANKNPDHKVPAGILPLRPDAAGVHAAGRHPPGAWQPLAPPGFSLLGQHCIIPKCPGQGGYDGNTDRHGSHGRYEASVRSGRRRGRGEGGGAFQEADRRRLTDPGKSFGSRPTPSHPNVHPIPRLAGTSGNRLRLGTHPVSDRVHEIGKHVAAIRNVDHFDAGHHPEQRTEPSFSAATPNSSKLRLTLI